MQKMIRILAIVAAALVAFAMFLLLLSFPLQRVIADKFLSYPDDMVGALPIFPWAQFVKVFLILGCAVLMIVCAGNKRGGIWLELVLAGCLTMVLPLLSNVLTGLSSTLLAQFKGEVYVASYTVTNMISYYCMWPAALGNSLALVVAGMSIVFKGMCKKLAKATE